MAPGSPAGKRTMSETIRLPPAGPATARSPGQVMRRATFAGRMTVPHWDRGQETFSTISSSTKSSGSWRMSTMVTSTVGVAKIEVCSRPLTPPPPR